MNDIQVILKALQRERDDLHDQLMQMDRIIKRVKSGTYSEDRPAIEPTPKQLTVEVKPVKRPSLPMSGSELKIQVLRVFDVLGVAITFKQIEAEHSAMIGKEVYLRDAVRALQKAKLLRVIKDKTTVRGFLWVKGDWMDGGQLLDKYKPEGFDLLYKPENLVCE